MFTRCDWPVSVALLAVGARPAAVAVDAATDKDASRAPPPPSPRDTLLKAVPDDDSRQLPLRHQGRRRQPMTGVLDAAKHSYRIGVSQTDPEPASP